MGALDVYNHYKFFHFFSICFGLGCVLLLYRPFYSIAVPAVLGVFFTIVFECVGASFGLPAHTKRCKGRPYHWKDVVWGYCMAFIVTILHLRSYHVYTLSCGGGLAVFAIRGAIRKYNALRSEVRHYRRKGVFNKRK